MPRRRKSSDVADYEALRMASGWYLRAWRDKANLSQEELAASANSTKSLVSDLERGAKRYNRLHIDQFSGALGVPGGYLIDVNPFKTNEDIRAFGSAPEFHKLGAGDQRVVTNLVRDLLDRAG